MNVLSSTSTSSSIMQSIACLIIFLSIGHDNSVHSLSLSDEKVCIIGGGPIGLFTAQLLLRDHTGIHIHVLEKEKRRNKNESNRTIKKKINMDFGMGVSSRFDKCLDAIPGLKEKVKSVSAAGGMIPVALRSDIQNQMLESLYEQPECSKSCLVSFGNGVSSINFEQNQVFTENGDIVSYDLLIAADGVRSEVRRQLN
mmetsp:Transcript_20168/g.23370  ORF Transcript_20168/g.23370 Transcript_20168/m.23370 type:complete len:198 (+) Transcript_20168:60-653(+)